MAENPYDSAKQPHGDRPPHSIFPFLGRLVIYGGIILIAIALMLPAVRSVRGPARRNQCLNNTKQILLALHNYHDKNGELPPAYSVDTDGNPLHSWRALLLPYIEGDTIHQKIDFTKPWDDVANAEAREAMPECYLCPSYPGELDEGLTTYLAVVGPEFAFNGSTPRTFSDIADGASNTIVVLDIPPDHAVHWMSPEDADESLILSIGPESKAVHASMIIAGYLDGHANAIDVEIDKQALRAQLTIAGGEEIEE